MTNYSCPECGGPLEKCTCSSACPIFSCKVCVLGWTLEELEKIGAKKNDIANETH